MVECLRECGPEFSPQPWREGEREIYFSKRQLLLERMMPEMGYDLLGGERLLMLIMQILLCIHNELKGRFLLCNIPRAPQGVLFPLYSFGIHDRIGISECFTLTKMFFSFYSCILRK